MVSTLNYSSSLSPYFDAGAHPVSNDACSFGDDITLLLQAEAFVTEPRPHLP